MDVFEAIRTVLAVRQFEDKPVPSDVIHQIVESAQLTGSASNRQPWHFIVVQNKDMLRQLGALARTGPYISQAPVAIVVVVEPGAFGVSDGSRAIQDMMLTAWDHGVGSNWVGFAGAFDAVKPLLNIPAELDILAILPFGYPTRRLGIGRKNRKPLAEVASQERYGQPYQ